MSSLGIENLGRVVQVDPVGQGERSLPGQLGFDKGLEKGSEGSGSFARMLERSIDQVNTHQVQADRAIHEMVSGRSKNLHETMLAIERADTSLKLMMQVRNKILDAYREIMRMQV